MIPHSRWNESLIGVATVALGLGSVNAASIAYNFSENPNNQVLDTITPKGPLGSSIWNDSNERGSGSLAAGAESGLLDGDGIPTGAAISWTSSNVWFSNSGTASENARIAVGYLDDGGGGVNVQVTGIPYAQYNIIGIIASDQSLLTYTTLDFQVNGTWVFGGNAPATATAFANWGSAGEIWTETTSSQTGNYWVARDLTGSSATIQGMARAGDNRGSLAGIIIQQVPEPSTTLIALPALFMLLGRRRRVTAC
jgi:hypothetical protein